METMEEKTISKFILTRKQAGKGLVSNNPLRDEVVECFSCSEIEMDESVILTAKSRDIEGGARLIKTSHVVDIKHLSNTITEFKTETGSTYQVEKLI